MGDTRTERSPDRLHLRLDPHGIDNNVNAGVEIECELGQRGGDPLAICLLVEGIPGLLVGRAIPGERPCGALSGRGCSARESRSERPDL